MKGDPGRVDPEIRRHLQSELGIGGHLALGTKIDKNPEASPQQSGYRIRLLKSRDGKRMITAEDPIKLEPVTRQERTGRPGLLVGMERGCGFERGIHGEKKGEG
jgi:hypothetical protein